MIKIDRTGQPASLDLGNPDSPASKERQRILDHLDATGEVLKDIDYSAYRKDDVKDLLKNIFGRKCAYCEGAATATADGDIEHYRPKKGVTEAAKIGVSHPGYWWLAMEWTNLLLSCQHCNQARGHIQLTGAESEEEIAAILEKGKKITTGKANLFPTRNDVWITEHDGDVGDEQPLLINPCEIDPEPLMEWEFERSLSTVKARDNDDRAVASINIYGLNRRDLTEARAIVLNRLRVRKARILERLKRFNEVEENARAQDLLEMIIEDLKDLRESNCGKADPFSALSKAFCDKLEAEVKDSFA